MHHNILDALEKVIDVANRGEVGGIVIAKARETLAAAKQNFPLIAVDLQKTCADYRQISGHYSDDDANTELLNKLISMFGGDPVTGIPQPERDWRCEANEKVAIPGKDGEKTLELTRITERRDRRTVGYILPEYAYFVADSINKWDDLVDASFSALRFFKQLGYEGGGPAVGPNQLANVLNRIGMHPLESTKEAAPEPGRKIVKVIVAAEKRGCDTDLFPLKIDCSDRQFADGVHRRYAQAFLFNQGYSTLFAYDEFSSAGVKMVPLFPWAKAKIVSVPDNL